MLGTCAGAQVISTIQARVDGAFPSARTPFPEGSLFRWFGAPLRLDGARRALLLSGAEGEADLRSHLPGAIAKLGRGRGSNAIPLSLLDPYDDPEALILSDGITRWQATMVQAAGGETLLVFADGLPPANSVTAIVQSPVSHAAPSDRKPICFTAGTLLDTPEGPTPVEALYPGDKVLTRDNGPQEVIWMGLRRVSGARMFALPALRPVRIRAGAIGNEADLVVSPGHQIMLAGPRARALWSTPEVLVRAGDLIDDTRVTVDHAANDVAYFHVLTARHEVLRANGAWCESFHPGDADLSQVSPAELEELLELVPGTDSDASVYGPHARRCLSAAELAILQHNGAPRYLRTD
ncbi:Hint domain-containing protein [Jannaschia pohangensis]|uniref:Hint domain-containing protein n=1 Tax=Jannaschia pohangensis TaxID=390807 RepID=A0A1I3LVF2_9RHOB|nr:Hint domain-containing protein [Jannaschia pohangensis]SFI88692.1 Hint domain-containing protein [Jannaschia pohangensis]